MVRIRSKVLGSGDETLPRIVKQRVGREDLVNQTDGG
jgi:hypothetical protein